MWKHSYSGNRFLMSTYSHQNSYYLMEHCKVHSILLVISSSTERYKLTQTRQDCQEMPLLINAGVWDTQFGAMSHIRSVKQSPYRPGRAQRVPGSYISQISWQRHMMVVGCQPYTPAAFTPRKYSWYSFLLEAESTPGPQCDQKDFTSMKNPLTPPGIEPATFRFVVQHLNHCATAVPPPPY